MTLYFLNDVETTRKSLIVIITSVKSEPMGKLINRLPGSHLLYQVYQTQPREHMLSPQQSLVFQQAFSKPSLVNLISKDTHLKGVKKVRSALHHRFSNHLKRILC